jgi:hypothetical protein
MASAGHIGSLKGTSAGGSVESGLAVSNNCWFSHRSDLTTVSGVSEIAIKNLERGATDPRVSTVNRIQEAFDRAGVIFLDTGDIRDGGPGLRLKRS